MQQLALPPEELLAERRTAALENMACFLAYARTHGLGPRQVAEWVHARHVQFGSYAEVVRQHGKGNVGVAVAAHVRLRRIFCPSVEVSIAEGAAVVEASPLLEGVDQMLAMVALAPEDVHAYLGTYFRRMGDALGLVMRWVAGSDRERMTIAGNPATLPEPGVTAGTVAERAAGARYRVISILIRALGLVRDRESPAEELGRFVGLQRDRAGVWAEIAERASRSPEQAAGWLARRLLQYVDQVQLRPVGRSHVIECKSFVPDVARAMAVYRVSPEDFGRYLNGLVEVAGERLGLRFDCEVGEQVFRIGVHRR